MRYYHEILCTDIKPQDKVDGRSNWTSTHRGGRYRIKNLGSIFLNIFEDRALRGVVVDLLGLRDRGPGFKTGSGPLTFTKAVTEFSEPNTLLASHALTNSVEFRHAKDVKIL